MVREGTRGGVLSLHIKLSEREDRKEMKEKKKKNKKKEKKEKKKKSQKKILRKQTQTALLAATSGLLGKKGRPRSRAILSSGKDKENGGRYEKAAGPCSGAGLTCRFETSTEEEAGTGLLRGGFLEKLSKGKGEGTGERGAPSLRCRSLLSE